MLLKLIRFNINILFILLSFASFSQKKHTISGYVKNKLDGETLIGTTIYVDEIKGGVLTNVYGFYSMTLPDGEYNIFYRFIGFQEQKVTVMLDKNITLDIELVEQGVELKDVIITGKRDDANVSSTEMSVQELNIKSITKLPTFAGEVDIIRSIQLLPGVSTVGEGASGFNVRGSNVGQNLVILDEAPFYQSSHLFGFFSVFNPDAIKDVKLYKGGIPSKYGGRLSSILDVKMREGNSKNFEVNAGIGTVFSRLAVEGPIIKDKVSYIIAGRRSYIDWLVKPFADEDEIDPDAQLYFYDFSAKINYKINDKNNISFSGYLGRDVFGFDARQGFNWGNKTTTLQWNHLFNQRLFTNFTLYYSEYDYGLGYGENDNDKFSWESKILAYNFKSDFTYFINTNNELNFGTEIIHYQFKPANVLIVSERQELHINLDEKRSLESSFFIENEKKFNDVVSIRYGVRFSQFNYFAKKLYSFGDTTRGLRRKLLDTKEYDSYTNLSFYQNIEPRISLKIQLTPTSSIKTSYNRTNQYIHLISNTPASLPLDIWQPSTNNIAPQQGNQVALGYFKNFFNNTLESSLEVYYKWNKNQIDYIDGANIRVNEYLEGELLEGEGRAYGMEFMLKRNQGKFNGWISYTLAKTELKIDGINFGADIYQRVGQWYPTRFDQRHNLKIVGNYHIRPKILISSIFTFISGTPTTFPTDRYYQQGYVVPLLANERHTVRIPDYHRLDLSITFDNIWRGRKNRKGSDYLVISAYNVYYRENPFAIYFNQNDFYKNGEVQTHTFATQIAVLGRVVPAISYNLKF